MHNHGHGHHHHHHHHHNHHHTNHNHHGHRRHTSRTAITLMNLPSHQVASSLYVAFRVYGEIARIKRDDSSTAVIAFNSEIDAMEMRRWEDQVQIDGLPLMVAYAESAVDDEVNEARQATPEEGEWKCWLCLNINNDSDETCVSQNCDVVRGIEKSHFDATLNIDLGEEKPPGIIPQRKRTVIIATDIPKDTDRSSIRRVFGRYGKIVSLWVNQVGGGTEAQVVFDREEAADAAVEFEHNRVLDSQPIIVWKATTAYVIEVQPVASPWARTREEVAAKAAHMREAYSKYGAITSIRVLPDTSFIEYPSLTSALSFLEAEPHPTIHTFPCHTSLSTKFSKWPCLSCTFPHNPARFRQCTQCSVLKPNFKIVNLPVMWPMQVELVKASLAAQREDHKKHQKEHRDHGKGGHVVRQQQQQFKPVMGMPKQVGQPVHHEGFKVDNSMWGHPSQRGGAVVPVAPPPTAVVAPHPQISPSVIDPPILEPPGKDQEVKALENLFEDMLFGANSTAAFRSRSSTPKKDRNKVPQRDIFDEICGDQGVIGSHAGNPMDDYDPWANAISFTKPKEEDSGLGGLLWGLKNMGSESGDDDDDGLIGNVGAFSFDN
eukprot:TRINITY_DN9628_c0_g1_i1.p1 TRINITY_DN9628_c0_g1~~TRINITY_DN9628_c0_g1_i1.p1  ORF type:complete len:603 (+),score=183.51 TRINITY_DN9628_c0_g1_i1:50-1858(+)